MNAQISEKRVLNIHSPPVYLQAVHSRIAFQRKYLISLGKMSPAEEESLRQAISSWRAEVIVH